MQSNSPPFGVAPAGPSDTEAGTQVSALIAELEIVRKERDRLLDRQQEISDLLRCSDPHKVVHDLRNLLNELQLYKMLADTTRS